MTVSPYLRGVLITLLGVLIISPDTLLIRLVEADPWTMMIWRGFFTGVVVIAWCALFEPRELAHVPKMGVLGWSAVMTFAAGNVLFLYAATHTLVANTLFLVSTSPVFAALIARFILGETVSRRTWITIAMTLSGIGIIASGSLGEGQGSLDGDLAAIAAAASMAASFSIARARKTRSTVPAMGLGAWAGALFGLLLAPELMPQPGDWAPILGMGLIVSPLAFICLTIGPRHITAADVGLLLLLEAVFGPLLVWWFIGEQPGAPTLTGGAVILLTLLASNLWLALSARRR
ncbi:MAG: EamA family transporter [Rhodobacterales bacterium]|nr:MAG: EamA family transporter [Rhodobacterales bacterium]